MCPFTFVYLNWKYIFSILNKFVSQKTSVFHQQFPFSHWKSTCQGKLCCPVLCESNFLLSIYSLFSQRIPTRDAEKIFDKRFSHLHCDFSFADLFNRIVAYLDDMTIFLIFISKIDFFFFSSYLVSLWEKTFRSETGFFLFFY